MKQNKRKFGWIWLIVLLLVTAAAVTTLALADRLKGYLMDDDGAIELVPEGISANVSANTSAADSEEDGVNASIGGKTSGTGENAEADAAEAAASSAPSAEASTSPAPTAVPMPRLEVVDDDQVWITDTEIAIFRVSYDNGTQNITVQSANGENVIAPGTINTYTFKVKNSGDAPMDYDVRLDAWITPEEMPVPVTGRLVRYDSIWVAGDEDTWATVSQLDAAEDKNTLGAGKFAYYTLEWQWPFENGDDALDTFFGNYTDEDITFTIRITTVAEEAEYYSENGLTPPDTGDHSNLDLWLLILGGAGIALLLLVFLLGRDGRRAKTEDR